MIEPDVHVKVSSDVHVRTFDGDLVLLDLAKGDYFGLNEVGALLWEGLAAGKTPREVALQIQDKYAIEHDVLLADLIKLTDDFIARGLVHVIAGD